MEDRQRIPRGKRFIWPEEPPRFRLTKRDLDIIRLVHEHRFARSTHLTRLLGDSHKKISGRLKLLFRGQYLVRPTAQIAYYLPGGGSEPMVCGLANEGARLLRELGLEIAKLDWSEKNRKVRAEFLGHALKTTDFRVALKLSADDRPGVILAEDSALIPSFPDGTRASPTPWTLRPTVRHKGEISVLPVKPDSAALLTFPDGTRRAYLVEIDRGTMPIERSDLAESSILRKLLSYDAAHSQGLHTAQFGWKTFRVLFVTNSRKRAESMRALAATADVRHRHLFLFADYSALTSADLLAHRFLDHRGQEIVLVPGRYVVRG